MGDRKKILLIITSALLTVSLTGCSGDKKNDDNTIGNNSSNTIDLNYNIEKSERKNQDIEVIDFDLGEDVLTDSNGRQVKYKIRGTMATPKAEGQYPLVIIGHGSHENEASNRYDSGFSYLVENIAKEGYIGLSLDIQMHFTLDGGEAQGIERLEAIYKKHMSKLKEANEGKDVGYKIDLKNKINLDNKVFIGHSRSGQDMLLLAENLKKENDNSVKGMISIAPPEVKYISKNPDEEQGISESYYADIATGFIIPEYDGDVGSLDGMTIYDEILNYDKERKNPVSAVFLKGGKHNFFNTLLKEDTTFLDSNVVIVNKLKEEEQREFIVNYTLDFLNSVIGDNNKGLFDENKPTPNSMYGYDVITKLNTPTKMSIDLIDTKNPESVKGDKVSVEATMEDWRPTNDKIGAFRDPRTSFNPINLLSLTWKEKGANVVIDTKENKDFSNYEAISMQLAQDPTNPINKKGVNQGFTLILEDKKGKQKKIIIGKETTVLEYINGKIADDEYKYYGNYTPIGEIRIPMSYFEGIDLTNIKSVSLLFDQIDTGNIVIEEMRLESKK